MNGPDALTDERRGGRAALSGAGPGFYGANPGPGQAATAGSGTAENAVLPPATARQQAGKRTKPARKPPGGGGGGDARRGRLSLSNWSVSSRLITVFALASIMGLVFGGLRVTAAVSSSNSYGRTAQIAQLAQQSTAFAQALEDERDVTAGSAAYYELGQYAGQNATPTAAVKQGTAKLAAEVLAAQRVTDREAALTKSLAEGIGTGFTPTVQAKAGALLTMIEGLPSTRNSATVQPPKTGIDAYTNAIGNIFTMDDVITSGSGDAALSDEVRALGGMSRAKDEASQQRAILYSALLEATVKNTPKGNNVDAVISTQALEDAGTLSALTTAGGLQTADLVTFTNAATPDQLNQFLNTVGGSAAANEGQLVEGFVPLAGGDPRSTFMPIGGAGSLGIKEDVAADTAYKDLTALIGQLRTTEQQVVAGIVDRSQTVKNQAFESALITAAIVVAAILLVLLVTFLVGRTLVNPLRRLRADALEIASVRLPARVAAAAAATEAPEGPVVVEPVGVSSTDEIGQVARAFDQVHAEAVRLAGNEASLRGSLNAMFISLSRRSVPLIDRLARMIDGMEQSEDDPDQLGNLFSMDHLVTRMRRNSENLLVLAGEEPVRKWSEPVPLADVARAAAAEIEQYNRVSLTVQPGVMVSGQVAADVVHLLAELIENATLFSPQTTQVRVSVMELASGGVLVEIRDEGVGISPSRLADMNWRLDHPPGLDVSVSRHMGLYAVAHLAARHGIRIRLRPGAPQGLSALVWLPNTLARQDRGPAGNGYSRAVGGSTNPSLPAGARPAAPTGPVPASPVRQGLVAGRHRTGGDDEGDFGGRGDVPGRSDTPGRGLPGRGDTPGRGLPGRGDTPGRDLPGRGDLPVRELPQRGGDLPARGGDLPVRGGGDLPVRGGGDLPVRGGGDLPVRDVPGRDLPGRGDLPRRQPAGAGTGSQPGQAARPATAWFAPKRPSSGDAPSPDEVTASWQASTGSPAASGSWPSGAGEAFGTGQYGDGAPGAAEPGEQTSSGLPRRVPRTNAHPGLSTPDFGTPAETGMAPMLGAPAGSPGAGYQEPAPYQDTVRPEAPRGDQLPTRRRSPESVRSRVTGFQLGSRDAVQAGPDRLSPHAGEENNR
jgi:signal transduction histidine kinase